MRTATRDMADDGLAAPDSHAQTLGSDVAHDLGTLQRPGQPFRPAGLTGAAGAVTSHFHPPGGWPAGHVLQQAADALLDGIAGLELRAAPSADTNGHGAGNGANNAAGHEQAASIARQVADMAQGLAALADRLVAQGGAVATDLAEADCIAFLESQFRIRRLRARHLVGISLGEPAWDILLDLAVAHYWRRETSVTSLCIAADVPSTTALRWINSMTREGLIVRRPCLRDGRRSFLAIAPAGYQAMLALAGDAMRATEKVRARYQRSSA